uniref:Ribokinase n=1 Tax=Panagrolaimus sp. ES5 TaxID=591445 RepID=A0AC34FA01_9BILA
MSSSKPLVIVGSIVQDCVSYTERFPNPGESVRGNDFKMGSGGKGANQGVQAAKLGASVTMIGRVGNDMFGDANINGLKKAGVNVEYIEKSDTAPTSVACITVDNKGTTLILNLFKCLVLFVGENSIVVTLGANLELNVERVKELEDVIAGATMVLCQFEINEETNYAAFEIARKHNVTTFYNAAPGKPGMDKEILKFTDILCTNENETEFLIGRQLSSIEDFKEASRELLKYGPKTIVVTLGAKGVLVTEKDSQEVIEVPRVKAVDTTGAGDSFCGSLTFLITKYPNKTIAELSRIASKIASMSVQKHGTQSSYPSMKEVRENGIEL